MEGKRLYKDIIYFMLAKELPGCIIGSMVTIIDADGRECLKCNGIEMDISLAKKYPDWFVPVYPNEHKTICKQNTINYIMEHYGKTETEALKILANIK